MQLPSSFRMAYERAEIAKIVADAGYAEVPRQLTDEGVVEVPEVRIASWSYQPLGALCQMRYYERRNIHDYQLRETRQLDEPHFLSVFHYRRPFGQLIMAKVEFDEQVAFPHSSQLDVWHNKSDWDEIMAVGDVLLRARLDTLPVTHLRTNANASALSLDSAGTMLQGQAG